MDSERWKSDGDCNKCRRETYCKKKCKAYQKATERILRRAMYEAIAIKMFKAEAE